jgi:hypothetical protein
MVRFVCLALGLVLLWPGAAEAGVQAFRSPSGNITCVMSTEAGGFAQCELRKRPHGGGFMIPRRGGVSRYDVGYDDLADQRFTLSYGRAARSGPFSCLSRRSGMRCVNSQTRHGFDISLQHQRVF